MGGKMWRKLLLRKPKLSAEPQQVSKLDAISTSILNNAEAVDGQEQSAQGGSTAIQAGRDIVIGMSYSDVKDVCIDVFQSNYYKLAGMARETAQARAEEITEEFLTKLREENPEGFSHANDPGFQHAVYTAQKEHARTGDKDLGSLLVDLLVDRSKQKERDIIQIVLDESLSTAPKLTNGQLASLSIFFVFRYTQNFGINSHDDLGEYFDRHIQPFVERMVESAASFQHLEFSGCGSIGAGHLTLETILSKVYQGLFMKGFDEEEVRSRQFSMERHPDLFIRCINDNEKFQVRGKNVENLDAGLAERGVSDEDKVILKGLYDFAKMSDNEIREKCIQIRPYMERVFNVWSKSAMTNFALTSVGIAIGHANVKRLIGKFADLAIWIN
jgi:hypothetical protein